MKINVLLEGGVGDLILATRFIAAAREQYPDAYLSVFVNNDCNEKFNTFLNKHWGYLWNGFYPDVKRVSKSYQIHSQFGAETYNGAFENIESSTKAKLLDADKFYNFHLDALKFIEYSDIPWAKYLKWVPRPRNLVETEPVGHNTVVVNLYAREGHASAITQDLSDSILSNLVPSQKVLIIAPTEEIKNTFYKNYANLVKVANLDESLALISQASIGLSIDSGLRCMFYPFGKACYTLCGLSPKPFEVPASHITRWYMWPEQILPLKVKPAYVSMLIENAMTNAGCLLYPQYTAEQIDRVLVKRNYG